MQSIFILAAGLWTSAFSIIFGADASSGAIDVSWQTLLLGYGPLGVFAIFVGVDRIGNNSERNRLRVESVDKDKLIATLHEKIESDIVPALVKSVIAQQEGAKALAEAVDIIREYAPDGTVRPNLSRRSE